MLSKYVFSSEIADIISDEVKNKARVKADAFKPSGQMVEEVILEHRPPGLHVPSMPAKNSLGMYAS